jgi:hypothetical protein
VANDLVKRTRENSVSAARQGVCYVRVTPIAMYRGHGNGIHIGLAHLDRDCTYLNPRTDNHCPSSQVIPISGPILETLRLCSKCAPKKWRGVTVDLSDTREIRNAGHSPLLLGPEKGAACPAE